MKLGKRIKYKIEIDPTLNYGFVVKVGCGLFAFSNAKDLQTGLDEYLKNPEKFEKEYNDLQGATAEEVTEQPVQPTQPDDEQVATVGSGSGRPSPR